MTVQVICHAYGPADLCPALTFTAQLVRLYLLLRLLFAHAATAAFLRPRLRQHSAVYCDFTICRYAGSLW